MGIPKEKVIAPVEVPNFRLTKFGTVP